MDWLRSEDLKEEKNVTTPVAIMAGDGLVRLAQPREGEGCSCRQHWARTLQQSTGLYSENIQRHFQLGNSRADLRVLSDLLLQRLQ